MRSFLVPPTAAVVAILLASPVVADDKANPEEKDAPTQASLVVGALSIGAHANLAVVGYDINVARDKIVYSYFMKNAGAAELALAAAVALPELRASANGDGPGRSHRTIRKIPSALRSASPGPATIKTEIHAYALGLDRAAEIKAAHLPLNSLRRRDGQGARRLSADAVDRLSMLGVVSPHDPAEPKLPPDADWSLEATLNSRLVLPAGKTTPVAIKFTPVAAAYHLGKGDEQDIEDMKDDLCLTAQTLGVLQGQLKKGGAWEAIDITLAVDAPTHWLDAPSPTLSVRSQNRTTSSPSAASTKKPPASRPYWARRRRKSPTASPRRDLRTSGEVSARQPGPRPPRSPLVAFSAFRHLLGSGRDARSALARISHAVIH